MLTPVYIIHESDEYDKFTLDSANRPIYGPLVERLKKSMQKHGFLAGFPITVSPDMVILDGQNRWQAAKELGIKFYYVVDNTLKPEHVSGIQRYRRNWTLEEYLHAYTTKGYSQYQVIKEFTSEFPDLHLSDVIWLCHSPNGIGRNKLIDVFSDGEYTADNIHFAREVATVLNDFKRYLPTHFRQRQFVYAIQHLLADPRYDHHRMLKKLGKFGYMLEPRVSTADYFPLLNKVYNYKVSGSEKIEFTFREYRKHRETV